MILAIPLLALLVSTNTCSAAVKGRPIISAPAVIQSVAEPHVRLGKGFGGGAVHHTAVVNDPISGPVVVEKVSHVGGIKGGVLGANSAQIALSDGLFGRHLYRTGPASYPFGLTGLDYYSYPNSLLTAPRLLRGKTIAAPNLSGLRPIGLRSGLRGGVIVDPTTSQFSIGDSQIKTAVFGGRNLYRSGLSAIPFGLTGLDYYSYPNNLLLQRSIDGGFGLRQTKILAGGSAFTAGDSQIRGPVVVAQSPVVAPLGQEKVTVVETDPFVGAQKVTTIEKAPAVIPQVSVLGGGIGEEFGQRKVTTTTITESADPIAASLGEREITQTVTNVGSGLRGGQIILGAGPGIGGLRRIKTRPVIASEPDAIVFRDTSGLAPAIGGFGQRQVAITAPVSAPIVQAPVIAAAPRVLQAPIVAPAPQIVPAPVAPVRVAQAPIIAAPAPVRYAPAPIFEAPAPVKVAPAPIFSRPAPIFARPAPIVATPPQVRVAPAPIFAAPAPIVAAPSPLRYAQAPIMAAPAPVVAAPAPVFSKGPGEIFLSQVARQQIGLARPAIKPVSPILGGGNIQFTFGGSHLLGGPVVAPIPRPIVTAPGPSLIPQGPVVVEQRPQIISQVKGGVIGNNILARKVPQMVYVDGGNRFLGIDTFGGYRVGDPRFGYSQLPISSGRFATLGSLSQTHIPIQSSIEAGPTLLSPEPAPIFASLTKAPVLSVSSPVAKTISVASPLGLSPITKTAPSVVTQEEVVGPLGDRQVVTTVTESDSHRLVGGKIGGPVVASPLGLMGVGQPATKTITQEEVVGPLGDPQVVTTVTKTEPAGVVVGPSKIGGLATGGLAAIGRAPSKTISQEEVVGPLGDRQVFTTVTESDSHRLVGGKIGGPVVASPLGLMGVGQPASKTITQEEVVGPLGDTQVVTTVTKTEPSGVVVGPSKIGGLATGGLAAVGHAPSKVITQEEVVGPAGDSQILTTVTETDSGRLVGGKIGGAVVSNPFGFAGVGQAAAKTITQEEVVGPLGDSQIVTTVTKTEQAPISPIVQQEELLSPISGLRTASLLTQEIAQDPIETAITQSKLVGPLSQTIVDPLGSGQTQVSIDSFGNPTAVTQVKEAAFADPLTGTVNKVTQVSNTPVADSIVQQNIADTLVQESISPAFGGGLRFSPRLTFLSQHPYDVPESGVLRSIITRPVVQQQQELEQILVKKK